MNPTKVVNASFAAVSVLFALVVRQLVLVVWDYFKLAVRDDMAIGAPELIAVAAGIALFVGLRMSKSTTGFANEAVVELSKVTWPQPKETAFSAVAIIIFVAIASIILFTFDFIWGTLSQKFISW